MSVDRYSQGIELFGSLSKNENGKWVKFEDLDILQKRILELEVEMSKLDVIVGVVLDNKISEIAIYRADIARRISSIETISDECACVAVELNMWKMRSIILAALLFIESLVIFYFY